MVGVFSIPILFAATVLSWGASWIAIKYQLGIVPIQVSLIYRFGIAALIIILWSFLRGYRLRFSYKEHLQMAIMGLFLFCINYYLFYKATFHLVTGLIAILFSSVVILNILNGKIFFGKAISPIVLCGGIIGIFGLCIIFFKDLIDFNFTNSTSVALVLCIVGSMSASIGQLLSQKNQSKGLPVFQTAGISMLYGITYMTIFALLEKEKFIFDFSYSYISSLVFLVIFASVVGWWSFLTLIGKLGADRAAYVTLLMPIVSLLISTYWEGFQWSLNDYLGVGMVLFGNLLIMRRKKVRYI